MNSAKAELIITALLTNSTVKKASASCGVPESTIYSYLKKPEFKKKYNKAKTDLMEHTTTYLQGKTAETIEIILSIAEDTENHAQTRLTACRTLLEYTFKFMENTDLLQRIEQLEALEEN